MKGNKTTDRPTATGWYFGFYNHFKSVQFIQVVYNFPEQKEPSIWVADVGYVSRNEIAWWWSEKIEFPPSGEIPNEFQFENHIVRIVNFGGKLWLVAKDMTKALGYASGGSSVTSLVSKVPPRWRSKKPVATPGGIQKLVCLSEQGLYFFLSRSNKPAAIPFQLWIAGEVIPLRKGVENNIVAETRKTRAELLVQSIYKKVRRRR